MDTKLSILGFAGSLRQGSYNRIILRAAQEMVPSGAELKIFDLAGIPRSTRTWKMSRQRRLRSSKRLFAPPMPC